MSTELMGTPKHRDKNNEKQLVQFIHKTITDYLKIQFVLLQVIIMLLINPLLGK